MSLTVSVCTKESTFFVQQEFDEVKLNKYSKVEAAIREVFSLLMNFVTGGKIPKEKFVKVIEDDGKISFVARSNIVSIGFSEDERFQHFKGNEQVQDKVLEILDPFNSGMIEVERLRKFLGTKEINWSGVPVSVDMDEDLEIVLAKLEQILNKSLNGIKHEVPLSWKDFVAMDSEEREEWAGKFVHIYGEEKCAEIQEYTTVDEVPENIGKGLDEIYNKELGKLEEKLQPGDIIFFKLDPSKYSIKSLFDEDEFIDYGILAGQKFAKHWMGGPQENESHSFIHVGLIVKGEDGKVMIAEATPGDYGDDVRLLDIRDVDARLAPGSKQEFRIVRAKDENARKDSAKVAATIAQIIEHNEEGEVTKVKDPKSRETVTSETSESVSRTKVKYSKKRACGCLFRNSKFDQKAKRSLFQTYAQLHREDTTLKYRNKARKFFCSYFASFSMQYGEAVSVIRKIIGTDAPDFNEMNDRQIKQWANDMVKKHGDKLDEIAMKVNPKNISPQRLRAFFHSHPDKYEDVLSIVKPQMRGNYRHLI
jgi:hypothetical protein